MKPLSRLNIHKYLYDNNRLLSLTLDVKYLNTEYTLPTATPLHSQSSENILDKLSETDF
jgi:hypothetical protein